MRVPRGRRRLKRGRICMRQVRRAVPVAIDSMITLKFEINDQLRNKLDLLRQSSILAGFLDAIKKLRRLKNSKEFYWYTRLFP